MAKALAAASIVTLKITLRDIKPPVWRRLLVPGKMTLGGLSEVILAAMGWHGGHLHAFDIGGEQYGDVGNTEEVANENRLTLNAIVKSGLSRFAYTYDFGDNWDHAVTIEKPKPIVADMFYPACIAGKRNCPPDDCGGPGGYEELLEILADPKHPEHAEKVEWIGEDFDPEIFDIDSANAMLAAMFKPT